MNWKAAGWLLAIPVVGAIVLPFVIPAHGQAIHDGLTVALAVCAVFILGQALTGAVTHGITRQKLEYYLLVGLGGLVVASGYGFAPKPVGGFVMALGSLVALVGGLRYARRAAKEQGQAAQSAL